MPSTLPNTVQRDLPVKAEKCAQANLRKAEMVPDYKVRIGTVVERARTLRGWTLDQLARHVRRNERQVARWISGHERAQFDALFAIPDEAWKNALVIAIAELGAAVRIETVIRVGVTKERA